MVRMKDIAERGKVSVMTVSKVLHDAPDISAVTKERIRRLATEMGYVPDALAQALRTRKTRLLGLLVPMSGNPFCTQMIAAIEDRAHELGYDLILAHTHDKVEREEACIRRMLARRVDGLLIHPVSRLAPTAAIYAELRTSTARVVLLDAPAPFCDGFCHVRADDQRASHALTKHLIALGHRRIAFFAGSSTTPSAASRRKGYHQALRDNGIPDEDDLIFAAGGTVEDGTKAALQMLDEGVKVTAVQAANDFVALGAANVFLGQGLKIPRDISIVGFGDLLAGRQFRVPLTTAALPQYRLGVAAADALFALLGGAKPSSTILAAEVIIRASSGPVGG